MGSIYAIVFGMAAIVLDAIVGGYTDRSEDVTVALVHSAVAAGVGACVGLLVERATRAASGFLSRSK